MHNAHGNSYFLLTVIALVLELGSSETPKTNFKDLQLQHLLCTYVAISKLDSNVNSIATSEVSFKIVKILNCPWKTYDHKSAENFVKIVDHNTKLSRSFSVERPIKAVLCLTMDSFEKSFNFPIPSHSYLKNLYLMNRSRKSYSS